MSKWKEWKESLGDSRPWHLFDEEKILKDESIANNRLDICLSCEFFNSTTRLCKKCGCFMPGKVRLANASCPIGKWHIEEQD
jgi:hypothetical protein